MTYKPFSLSLKILIQSNDGKYLFLRRSNKSTWNPLKWDLAGGKADNGGTLEDELLREVVEETKLDVRITGLQAAVEDEIDNFRIVHVVMRGECDGTSVKLSHEHDNFAWLEPSEFHTIDLCEYLHNILSTI